MEKFLMDEKYEDFLLLADKDDCNGHFYAFKFQNTILVVEDIPVNYPCITILETDLKELKKMRSRLQENDWEIRKDHLEEAEENGKTEV